MNRRIVIAALLILVSAGGVVVYSIFDIYSLVHAVATPDDAVVDRLAGPIGMDLSRMGLGAMLGAIGLFIARHFTHKDISEFENWLRVNASTILSDGASYRGTRITGDSGLSQFMLAVSVILFTFKIPSRYYVDGHDSTLLAKLMFTLATLLCGWWGIPWGPIYTVQSLAKNLSGGYTSTVRQYLQNCGSLA